MTFKLSMFSVIYSEIFEHDMSFLMIDGIVPQIFCGVAGINHGDLNDHNILVEWDGPSRYKISGIVDFGDMSSGYFIFELAISMMYMMIESRNPLEVGGPLIAGFESVFPLNSDERDALYTLVLSRFCQSLVYAHSAVLQQPENEEYLMITARNGLRLLKVLWEKGKEEIEQVWFEGAANISKLNGNNYHNSLKC